MANISLTTILYAVAGGVLPTFLWLWFWLSHDEHPEPAMTLTLAFIGGALGVLLLLPAKSLVTRVVLDPTQTIVFYAALEELTKVILVAAITFGSSTLVDATDYTIFLITGALGFSALENTFYLIDPLIQQQSIQSIVVTGNLRFFGATVLHTMTVAIVGVLLGLSFQASFIIKLVHAIVGIALGIGLHSVFNYFIMQNTRQTTIIAIAGIWFVAVIIILLFDRLRAFHAQINAYPYQEFKLPS